MFSRLSLFIKQLLNTETMISQPFLVALTIVFALFRASESFASLIKLCKCVCFTWFFMHWWLQNIMDFLLSLLRPTHVAFIFMALCVSRDVARRGMTRESSLNPRLRVEQHIKEDKSGKKGQNNDAIYNLLNSHILRDAFYANPVCWNI